MIINALNQRVLDGDITQTEANDFIAGIRTQVKAVGDATRSTLDNLDRAMSTSGKTAQQEADEAFQKTMDYWDNRIGANEAKYEQIQNDIDWLWT
jgi:uncharacterized protein YukE